jgi:peptidoglycan/LPS O-acetylase OafA/YrhL
VITEEASATTPADAAGSTTYRPHLDGLRAVAVYLVLLFHAGSATFSGGYIGVDVFFVLSGYLVTQLLFRDVAGRGAIRFGRFYARRFRRLLPAAFVALIVTGLVYSAIGSPVDVARSVGSFKAAFLYSTNWYFIHQSKQYFGGDISTNPILNFWSLAVEEQFYLVWPLLLGGAFVLTRRTDAATRIRLLRVAVAAAGVGSVAWALWLRHVDLNRAYYGTDARAYQLLAGALLALTPALFATAARYRRAARLASILTVLALVVLALSWVHLDAIERGIAATAITCVLIVAMQAADGGPAARMLSTRPFVYLGKISYGTYLWHWLVILVLVQSFHISTISTIAIAFLVATALAALSFELLEQPVRVSRFLDGRRRVVIAAGLTISVVSAVVLVPRIVKPEVSQLSAARDQLGAQLTPRPAGLLQDVFELPHFVTCLGKPLTKCALVSGTGRRVLLIGDSQALLFFPLFIKLAKQDHLQLYVAANGGCPWQRDLYSGFQNYVCQKVKADAYSRMVSKLRPDVIVVAGLDYGTPGTFTKGFENVFGGAASRGAIDASTEASITGLRAPGRKVVIIESLPIPVDHTKPFDSVGCLAKAEFLESCRIRAEIGPTPLERTYRKIAAEDDDVFSLSLDRAVCPALPVCDPVVDGQVVHFDAEHLTVPFSQALEPQVDEYLKSHGIIPPGR